MLRCASIGLGWWAGEHASVTHGKSQLLRIEVCHTDTRAIAPLIRPPFATLPSGSARAHTPASMIS